jgi:titin
VQGNFIGTDVSGTHALGNTGEGVYLVDASFNLIGGPGRGNVISANGGSGVDMLAELAPDIGNKVEGNWIGTDRSGTLRLGNHWDGVSRQSVNPTDSVSASYGNEIGGADTLGPVPAGVGNTVAFNTLDAVSIKGQLMVSNPVRGKSIYGNGGLGINTQDPPGEWVQLLYGNSASDNVTFVVFNPTPCWAEVVVDFYASAPGDAPPGGVQGRRYLGSYVVQVPPEFVTGGPMVFTVPLAKRFAKGELLSATLTDYWVSTSGFSNSVAAV